MNITQAATCVVKVLKPQKWAEGLTIVGLTDMLFIPHFGHSIQVNTYVKQLLVWFHKGYLWLDQPYPVNDELIARITGLPTKGKDPLPYLDKNNTKPIKQKHNIQREGQGYLLGPI